MEMAMVGRITAVVALAVPALLWTGAKHQEGLLEAFDAVLTFMAYAAVGLCLFSIVWAAFVLMAEGSEERGGGRARSAVVMAVVGLVLVLSAKGVSLLLLRVVFPIFFHETA